MCQHDPQDTIAMLTEQLNSVMALDDSQLAAIVYVQRGIAYEGQSIWQLALEDFNHALALQEDLLEAYVFRALAHQALEHPEDALNDYTHALTLHQARGETETHPAVASLYCDRGYVYAHLNRLEEGLADVEQSLAMDTTRARAWAYRARILGAQGKGEEALASMEQAIALEPKNADYYWQLGLLCRKIGNLFAMHEAYLRATELQLEAVEGSNQCQPKPRE